MTSDALLSLQDMRSADETSGIHSARLERVIESLVGADAVGDRTAFSHVLSRIGNFAAGIAEDLSGGSLSAAGASELLERLAAVGDAAFRCWIEDGGEGTLRAYLCEPVSAIFVAAERLSHAVELHNLGDRSGAEELLRSADDPAVREFTDRGWGRGAAARYGFKTTTSSPPYLPKESRPVPRMPVAATMAQVLERDGRHCRFCGIPVISAAVRRRVQAAYPEVVTWGTTNGSQHSAFQCMWLQYDHLLPNSRGGDSSLENVVVACAVCNFGRMQATLSEARLLNPLDADPPIRWRGHRTWDGLEAFLASEGSDPTSI